MNKTFTYSNGEIVQKPEMEKPFDWESYSKPELKPLHELIESTIDYKKCVGYEKHISSLPRYAAPASLWEKEGIKKDDLAEGKDFELEPQFWNGTAWWPTKHLIKIKEGTKLRTIAIPLSYVVMPEWRWRELRYEELNIAIEKYSHEAEEIPQEWIDERYNHQTWLHHREQQKIKPRPDEIPLTPAPKMSKEMEAANYAGGNYIRNHMPKSWDDRYNSFIAGYDAAKSLSDSRVKELEGATKEEILSKNNIIVQLREMGIIDLVKLSMEEYKNQPSELMPQTKSVLLEHAFKQLNQEYDLLIKENRNLKKEIDTLNTDYSEEVKRLNHIIENFGA